LASGPSVPEPRSSTDRATVRIAKPRDERGRSDVGRVMDDPLVQGPVEATSPN